MIPLQIIVKNFSLTPSVRTAVEERVARFENFFSQIVRCEVILSDPHRHKRKGRIYHVTIRLEVPGPDVVVSREAEEDESHESLQLALHDAFQAAERRLEDYVRRLRGEVKPGAARSRGVVVRLVPDLDYGFIETAAGDEIYFHRNSVKGSSFDRLKEGTLVHYHAEAGEKGPQAVFVRVARKARRSGIAA